MLSMDNSQASPMNTLDYAKAQDQKEPLRHLRQQFIIPSRADLKDGASTQPETSANDECTYLCGNSLGVQPRVLSEYVNTQLNRWATKGVHGHFQNVKGSVIPNWIELDDAVTDVSSKIVGARRSEVAVMQTLTANLHLLMASFYRPTAERYKIILEGKAFPSDHYMVESQIRHHNLSPSDAMILVEPPSSESPLLPTSHILSIIDKHASSTALLLLPGIQYYTGQYFDIKKITAHAQSKGITVGWDLAHAVGNLPLQLHDWNVDFAAWCNYKYMNCGPGAIGGLFVHSRHTDVSSTSNSDTTNGTPNYRPRLSGWWGSDKKTRFQMSNDFIPIPGAGGFQLSNPSALDLSAVLASLSVFAQTDMQTIRERSLRLTGYLEKLLDEDPNPTTAPYTIITPRNPEQRGAQLSVRLQPGLLDHVMHVFEEKGVVVDERKPDVVRVAPAPLYNSFEDVWRFVAIFREACRSAVEAKEGKAGSVLADGGEESKGWAEIK